jgi:hypothetical protein
MWIGAALGFAAAATAAGWGAGCSGKTSNVAGGAGQCRACTTDNDCSGGVCAQFQGDSFCAPKCGTSTDCASNESCSAETSVTGDQTSVCVPSENTCGTSVGPASDGGPALPPGCDAAVSAQPPDTCGTLVGPNTTAACNSCGTTHTCQPNGCYGGWWCDTSTSKCHAPPASCAPPAGDAGAPPPGCTPLPQSFDAGTGPITGTVGPNGGSVSRLFFTVIGDTRPASPDDTAGYPTAVIQKIYADVAALNPAPLFSVSTGDYMFASTSGGQASPQLDMYLSSRSQFGGVFFPAMGNHECTGATASNCGAGNSNGVTDNMTQFLNKLLGPIQKTAPYYSIEIDAMDMSWTSKFVFVAANAWDSTQASWLQQTMAKATTYTFVVRHESSSASTAPGVSPSDQIIGAAPYTLLIVGHSHTYSRPSQKQVLFGNGGAPITGSANYGYGVFTQRQDGAIVVDAVDYQSNVADGSFHFAVKPDGSAATP